MQKKIFITGGGGYVGSRLVPYLLQRNYEVCVYDLFFFGKNFLPNKNLKIVLGDIRDHKKLLKASHGYNYFLHLACISNDSSFELDENLSKSINFDCFEPLVLAARNAGIFRFIYASSSSVYGVSDAKNITEEHPLVPLTLYNKFKGMCEPLLFNHTNNNFEGVIFRPATVCGYSPRMRFDLTVNILTNYAVKKNEIMVFGGDQLRPNLHIEDYCEAVLILIESESDKIKNQIFNVGYENLSILEIAKKVKLNIENFFKLKKNILIKVFESNDKRSYHINSDKIKKRLNFIPKRTIEVAIKDICKEFIKGNFKDSFENTNYFNVKKIKELNIK